MPPIAAAAAPAPDSVQQPLAHRMAVQSTTEAAAAAAAAAVAEANSERRLFVLGAGATAAGAIAAVSVRLWIGLLFHRLFSVTSPTETILQHLMFPSFSFTALFLCACAASLLMAVCFGVGRGALHKLATIRTLAFRLRVIDLLLQPPHTIATPPAAPHHQSSTEDNTISISLDVQANGDSLDNQPQPHPSSTAPTLASTSPASSPAEPLSSSPSARQQHLLAVGGEHIQHFWADGFFYITNTCVRLVLIILWLLALDWRIGLLASAGFVATAAAVSAAVNRLLLTDLNARASLALGRWLAAAADTVLGRTTILLANRRLHTLQSLLAASEGDIFSLSGPLGRAIGVRQCASLFVVGLGAVMPYLVLRETSTASNEIFVYFVFFALISDMYLAYDSLDDHLHLYHAYQRTLAELAALESSASPGPASSNLPFDVPTLAANATLHPPKTRPFPPSPLVLSHVTAAYPPQPPVLRDMCFEFAPGSITGIVGETGCGKSTLLKLAIGLLAPQQGAVLAGASPTNIHTRLPDWFASICVVMQEEHIFASSVLENIAYGLEEALRLDKAELRARVEGAARRALCHDFIVRLPDGYDTLLPSGGLTLSGGQRQRLVLARAFLMSHRPFLFLDEPTSALDDETQSQIVANLHTALAQDKRTCVLVTHRREVLALCTRVVHLKRGLDGSAAEVAVDGDSSGRPRPFQHPSIATQLTAV